MVYKTKIWLQVICDPETKKEHLHMPTIDKDLAVWGFDEFISLHTGALSGEAGLKLSDEPVKCHESHDPTEIVWVAGFVLHDRESGEPFASGEVTFSINDKGDPLISMLKVKLHSFTLAIVIDDVAIGNDNDAEILRRIVDEINEQYLSREFDDDLTLLPEFDLMKLLAAPVRQ